RRRHTSFSRDWSSDVCSSDLVPGGAVQVPLAFLLVHPDVRDAVQAFLRGHRLVAATVAHFEQLEALEVVLGGQGLDRVASDRVRSEERRVGKQERTQCARMYR